MKLSSWNINGIRSVYDKGFKDWVGESNPDIICLQELKAHGHQIPLDITGNKKYHIFHNAAEKKGYSGVAVFTKKKPQNVHRHLGYERFDNEGRMLRLDFDDFTLINLYIPHGARDKSNLNYKLDVYKYLFDYISKIKHKNLILTGDFNIAHKEIDLARPKDNKKNIMFTPEERAQIDELIKRGFADTFREFHKDDGRYTWWPWRNDARSRNIGWRIDYIFAGDSIKPKLQESSILREVLGSDHCPITCKFTK